MSVDNENVDFMHKDGEREKKHQKNLTVGMNKWMKKLYILIGLSRMKQNELFFFQIIAIT